MSSADYCHSFNRMAIRWALEDLMMERGWTAYRLAKEAGLTPSAVYKLMAKDSVQSVETRTLEALARTLDVHPLDLLRYDP